VASIEGISPLRGKRGTSAFVIMDQASRDGFKITKEDVIKRYTDDGKLVSSEKWNKRH